jgi:hypothetical protein
MALKAVVTASASSATMHGAIQAQTQDFCPFSRNSGVVTTMSSRLLFYCPCGEDDGDGQRMPRRRIFVRPHPSAGSRRLQSDDRNRSQWSML